MTGIGGLLRFMLRRERRGLPWWLLGATLLVLTQSTQSQNLYDTPEDLAKLRQTIGSNAAVIATSGPTRLLHNIGGEVVFEMFAFVAIVVALMNMFLVGRHTRADEESGRAELVRSAKVGRHAPLTAALALAGLANLATGLLVFVAAAGTGLPASGSILFGIATAAVGATFAALTAVAVQVFEKRPDRLRRGRPRPRRRVRAARRRRRRRWHHVLGITDRLGPAHLPIRR